MTQAVKRACDACHRRKVKCDGVNPCRNCATASLSCTYNAVPQKKGPKGSRAKVISELRDQQRATSLAAKVSSRINSIGCPSSDPATSSKPTPGLITSELIKDCANFFFDNMYDKLPFLDRSQIENQVLYMEQTPDAYCLLTAFCAFVMIQPGMNVPTNEQFRFDMVPGANIHACQLLIEETVRVRRASDYLSNVTCNSVATDFFLYASNYAMEMHDQAWYFLREATTLVHLAGMHQEDYYRNFDPADSSRRRRLFWLLYAAERSYALRRNWPVSLHATINLPTASDDPQDPHAQQLHGFLALVNLFKPIDEALINNLNKTRNTTSQQHINSLQSQLPNTLQSWVCQDSSFADPNLNQQWLQSLTWQCDDSPAYPYNSNTSRDIIMAMAHSFSGSGREMELAKPGLLEKFLDVTRNMIQYYNMQPPSGDPFSDPTHDQMSMLLNLVALSRNNDHRFLPILFSNVADQLSRIVNPMLQKAPATANYNMANMDMFDGFGNAGMAQVPQMMQTPIDTDFKLSAEEYDKQYAMEMSQATPESQTNTNSSYGQAAPQPQQEMKQFVSSPGMMSPGMEYPPQMSAFASTPMSEMVMSPMGHPSQNHMGIPQQQPHMGGPNHDGLTQHSLSMSQHMPSSHPMSNMRTMQPPQRQPSFHLQPPPAQMRTVGDFQGMQGRNDGRPPLAGMGSMDNEIDFGALQ